MLLLFLWPVVWPSYPLLSADDTHKWEKVVADTDTQHQKQLNRLKGQLQVLQVIAFPPGTRHEIKVNYGCLALFRFPIS